MFSIDWDEDGLVHARMDHWTVQLLADAVRGFVERNTAPTMSFVHDALCAFLAIGSIVSDPAQATCGDELTGYVIDDEAPLIDLWCGPDEVDAYFPYESDDAVYQLTLDEDGNPVWRPI